jgi:hypothetical protein
MITTQFNQRERYLESKVESTIHLQEFINNTHNILKSKSYPKNLRILDDHRNADYLFPTGDIDKILDTLLEDIDCLPSKSSGQNECISLSGISFLSQSCFRFCCRNFFHVFTSTVKNRISITAELSTNR